jgi:hypothetical protein
MKFDLEQMFIPYNEPDYTVKVGDATQEGTGNVRDGVEPESVNDNPSSPQQESENAISKTRKESHLDIAYLGNFREREKKGDVVCRFLGRW